MSKLVKLVGLLFLPIAVIAFMAALFYGKPGKSGKGVFIQEFDEQNIYG